MRWQAYRFYRSCVTELVWLLAGGAALSAAWPQSVRADEALEEITVTAQRVTERLQDVPVAVTAISASELLKRGVRQAAISPPPSRTCCSIPRTGRRPSPPSRCAE